MMNRKQPPQPKQPTGKRHKLLALLLLAALAALFVVLSLEGVVRLEMLGSSRHQMWSQYWAKGGANPQLSSGGGLLPTQVPGPADKWAGGKSHGVDIQLTAPPGDYTLVLRLNDSHEAALPLVVFYLDGKEIAQRRLKPGQGRPAPYHAANPGLTLRLPLTLTKPVSTLGIVNQDGSWLAPAALQLEQGTSFNPAKAGYLLLSYWRWFVLACLLLLAGVYCWSRAGSTRLAAMGTVLLVVFSAVLALAGAEYLLREYLVKFPQARRLAAQKTVSTGETGQQLGFQDIITPNPDPAIVYTLKPGLNGRFGTNSLVTNSCSMRGAEVGLQGPPGVLRVAGLGDSVMFGWGVDYPDTALYQLGEILGKRLARGVEMLNFACPSYNTAVEVAVYQKIARGYKPDLAVLIFVINDFGMPSMLMEPVERFSLRRFYLWEQLRRRLGAKTREAQADREFVFMSQRHQAHLDAQGQERRKNLAQRLEPVFKNMTGQAAVARYLQDWAAMLGEDGISGVVVYYPNMVKPLPDKVAYVLAAGQKAGLHTIDMTPIYRRWLAEHGHNRMKDALWVSPVDSHPNRASSRLMAQAVAHVVLKNKLLPAK